MSERTASCSWALREENTSHPQNMQLPQTSEQRKEVNNAALMLLHTFLYFILTP